MERHYEICAENNEYLNSNITAAALRLGLI
jgi:hypothetical protein